MVNCNDFQTKAGTWPVTFNIWSFGKNKNKEFLHKILDYRKGFVGWKILYFSGSNINQWVKSKISRTMPIIDMPKQSSGFKFQEKGTKKSRKNHIMFLSSAGNDVSHNPQFTSFVSTTYSNGNAGSHVYEDNFIKSCAVFAARRLIKQTWINNNDEYMAPNEKHPYYELWNNDAVIYNLFHPTHNNCTAVREVQYKGKPWNIKNNFFWHSKEEMMQLANEHHFYEMYSDAKNDNTGESYLATIIGKLKFSDKAVKVLELADELLKDSMDHREEFHYSNDEKNLQAWDSGYYQLKFLWREKHKILHAKFQKAYKELEEQMRPMVYELGFLKK